MLVRCFILFFMANIAQANWHQQSFDVMGTSAHVEFWEPDEQKARQLIERVVSEMQRIDATMSPYIESSELSRINNSAANHPVKISEELFQLLKKSVRFSEMTKGAFDITFASVGYLYDYRERKAPSDETIEQRKELINFRSMHFDDSELSVSFTKQGVRIDLGGIAKGHAVDNCISLLEKAGIQNAFVQAGGDSRLLGDKKGRLWTIGIRHPREKDKVLTQVPLENVAISTSGDYERFFIDKGERIHHIINPKSGKSASDSISVSIIASDSTTADALSTSVFVLGPEKGLQLINQLPGISAIIIDKNGKLQYSDDLLAQ